MSRPKGLCFQTTTNKGDHHAVEKTIGSSSLVEVIDRILDKGVVVDAWVRVSLVGIELLAIEQGSLSHRSRPT